MKCWLCSVRMYPTFPMSVFVCFLNKGKVEGRGEGEKYHLL